jgi:dolichyl-phosphate-mannose-protein mannosyltransferase
MKRLHDNSLILLMLAGAGAYLYFTLFIFPGTPVLLSGDQVFFWMFGQRMLSGELPYLNFFQFTPPGTDLAYFSAFKAFGVRVWVTNTVVLVLGLALCWVCFLIARRIMGRSAALLATLLYLTLIYSRLLNATHHLFSVLAIMSAVCVLMRRTDALGLAASGALLAIASFFSQAHGVVALLAFSLFLVMEPGPTQRWRNFWKTEGTLLAGFFAGAIGLNGYFLARVGLRRLLYFQVYYVLKQMVHSPETALLGIPGPEYWRVVPHSYLPYEYAQMVFTYAVLPVSYLLALRRSWHRSHYAAPVRREVLLLALVGAFLLGELVFSLNWLRLYAVSMAGIILFVWLLSASHAMRRYLVMAAWVTVFGLAVQRVWYTQRHQYRIADLPGGTCATETNDYIKLSWVMRHTRPGDYFLQAGWPGMYIPLGLRNPVFIDSCNTMFNPVWAPRAVQELKARPTRLVLWPPRLDYPVDPNRPMTAHIVPLRSYVHAAYRRVHVFPDGEEVWEKK